MRLRFVSSLVISALGGCVPADNTARIDRYDDVAISPPDLTTNYGRDGFALGVDGRVGIEVVVPMHFPDFETSELPMWEGNLRLVHWPDATLVPGRWRAEREPADVVGAPFAFRFETESPLDEGWYAVQVNFDGIDNPRGTARHDLPRVDGWTTSRFRVGSQPLMRAWGSIAASAESVSGLDFQVTERLPVSERRDFFDYLKVTVDAEPHRCWTNTEANRWFDPSRGFEAIIVQCDPAPLGASVDVVFLTGFTDTDVMDLEGNSPPHWTFRVGESAEGDGPADALFEVTREAP